MLCSALRSWTLRLKASMLSFLPSLETDGRLFKALFPFMVASPRGCDRPFAFSGRGPCSTSQPDEQPLGSLDPLPSLPGLQTDKVAAPQRWPPCPPSFQPGDGTLRLRPRQQKPFPVRRAPPLLTDIAPAETEFQTGSGKILLGIFAFRP